jgi:hypothetical protein
MVIEYLIDKIDKLQQPNISKFDKFKNPLLGLITSGWYFSNSFRLFQEIPLNWENCKKTDFISNLANKLDEIDISIPESSIFELSFCSWYQPYHYIPRDKWGIHIRYRCWQTLSVEFYRECPNLINNHIDSVLAAFFYLYVHGFFHYLIENVITCIELECNDPFLYANYLSDIYVKVFNTSKCLEEALANSYLFERSNLCHIEKQYFQQKLSKQNPGYNNFIDYTETKFKDGVRELISEIVKHSNHEPNTKMVNNVEKDEFANTFYLENIPIWIHQTPLHMY